MFHGFFILALLALFPSPVLGGDFQIAVEKNLFSPERRYEPYFPEKKGGVRRDILERYLILRGTLVQGRRRLAVIEVLPAARREIGLSDTKRKRFVVAEGEDLGDCPVVEVRPEKIILGGPCQGLTLTLQDAPERKRPAPVPQGKTLAKPLPKNIPKKIPRRPPKNLLQRDRAFPPHGAHPR